MTPHYKEAPEESGASLGRGVSYKMSLAARRSSRLREGFVIRLGCLLVSFAVLVSLILEPPKAKAFAMTSSAVTALAGGFLNACGLAPVVSGMSSSGEVNEAVARLIQEYLDAEVMGASVGDWLSSFGQAGLAVHEGKLILAKPLAENLMAFAQWVASKYGTKAGVQQVYAETGSYVVLQDGNKLFLSAFSFVDERLILTSQGSLFSLSTDLPICFSTGYRFDSRIGSDGVVLYDYSRPDGTWMGNAISSRYMTGPITIGFNCFDDKERSPFLLYHMYNGFWKYASRFDVQTFETIIGSLISADESLSLDVSDTMQQVLDRLTALEEGQSIALDVGATQSMEIQDILQGILDAILAGELDASAEIVDEAEQPVDPDPPPVVPVVPEGLDRLGAALTSRFPFSIPWDVYKGVSLLAAPAKAPYFEVDLLAPIAHRVGGWQGSTTIVLDFSEYEIIGQVCRWTSTIGFCLMLAAGTKRLIWTA